MSGYRLRLVGLSETDVNSVKSMLRLSKELLSAQWHLIEEGEADLVICAVNADNEQPMTYSPAASGLTAALTQADNVSEGIDIVLKKPLRKSSFSQALNLTVEKLKEKKISGATHTSSPNTEAKPKSASWLSRLFNKSQPDTELPKLSFPTFDDSGNARDTIKDKALLASWLDQLTTDTNQRVGTLLTNLGQLNKLPLKPAQHFELLELYRTAISDIMFRRDISAVKRDLFATTENLKAIRNIHDLLEELVKGYLKVVHHFYQRGETPKTNPQMLLGINRSAEHIALSMLQSFYHYRVVPEQLWTQINEFYHYLEAADALREEVIIKEQKQCEPFYQTYMQILLTAMSDPYSLAKFEVLRLFQLLKNYVGLAHIGPVLEKQLNLDSSFMLTGLYCINLKEPAHPLPMEKTPFEARADEHARLLDLQPLTLELNRLKKSFDVKSEVGLDIEQKLILKIIPQLSTTRARRYHRLKTAQHRKVTIADGIKAIHQNLSQDHKVGLEWHMSNQSSGGIMAFRSSKDCQAISIGDFIGIFEADYPVKLALVRWLMIDTESDTFIGLELVEGSPTPALCMPDGEAVEYPALLMPHDDKEQTTFYVYTEKGLFSPKRKIRIKKAEQNPYIVIASKLSTSTLDYELFSYTVPAGS